MDFTPIRAAEFPEPANGPGRGKPLSPFSKAVRGLVLGSGFSMPCKWTHGKNGGCPGRGAVQNIKTGIRQTDATFNVRTRCKDGTFYVLRVSWH